MKTGRLLTASATFIIAFMLSIVASSANAQQTDVEKVHSRLVSYFFRLVAISENSPPPAPNAANGFFVNSVHGTDVELGKLVNEPIPVTSNEGQRLVNYYNDFTIRVRTSFEDGTHFDSGVKDIGIAMETFYKSRDQLVESVENIDSSKPSVIMSEINKVAQSIDGKFESSGTHGNGYVSKRLRNFCNELLAILPQPNSASTAKGQKIILTMRVTCQAWAALPTDGHDPWLTGGWQAGFQGIAAGGAALLME